MSAKTVISLRGTLEHDLERLGRRAEVDPIGAQLLHDIRGVLVSIEGAEATLPPPETFRRIVSATMAVHERVIDYLTGRDLPRVEEPRHPSQPPPEIVEQIAQAIDGPDGGRAADTMSECPACRGCALCGDRRFVRVADAVEWRARHASVAPPSFRGGQE